jgi:hypothetical protein
MKKGEISPHKLALAFINLIAHRLLLSIAYFLFRFTTPIKGNIL